MFAWRNQRDGITIEMGYCIHTIRPYNWVTQDKCVKRTTGKLYIFGKKRSYSFEKYIVFYGYYGDIYLALIIISPILTTFPTYVSRLLATTKSYIVHKLSHLCKGWHWFHTLQVARCVEQRNNSTAQKDSCLFWWLNVTNLLNSKQSLPLKTMKTLKTFCVIWKRFDNFAKQWNIFWHKGAIIFSGEGESICDGRSSIFSGPPLHA